MPELLTIIFLKHYAQSTSHIQQTSCQSVKSNPLKTMRNSKPSRFDNIMKDMMKYIQDVLSDYSFSVVVYSSLANGY